MGCVNGVWVSVVRHCIHSQEDRGDQYLWGGLGMPEKGFQTAANCVSAEYVLHLWAWELVYVWDSQKG